MWLRRIALRNIRSFREAEIELPRNGLVLLVGPNNVGKTALLSVFDVLRAEGPFPANRFSGAVDPARMVATFELDDIERSTLLGEQPELLGSPALRQVEFTFEERLGSLVLLEIRAPLARAEVLSVLARMDWPENGPGPTGAASFSFTNLQMPTLPEDWPLATAGSFGQSLHGHGQLNQLWPIVAQWRASVFFFQAQRPGTTPTRDLVSAVWLEPSGANLPQALVHLKTNPQHEREWNAIQEVLNDVVADLGDMATPTNASHVSLVFTDPYLGVQRNVKELGSGVEQIVLAAYVGERLPANGTLVIEEPESHLHPDAQRRLLPHLLRWADDRLVLVSTHSTVLLDQGTAGGASVWLIERREGVATIRQADAVLPEVLAVLGVRLSDVLSAERVVVVEGTSDADVLRVFFDRELIAARANLVAGGRGGDAAWHVEAFSDWYAASDVLDRDITFVRDRDELSDEDVRRLEQTERVRVLGRRELENYLLDEPDALGMVIARRLQEAGAPNAAVKSADVEKRMRDAADSLKATLVLKRVVAELGPLRLLDRATVKSLVEGKASAAALAASIRERTPDIESRADEVLSIWDAVEAKVNDEWEARWRQLAPGADVLSQVFDGHGLEFSKTKDAVAIAREMQEPPDDLRAILGAVLSLSPEE